MKTCNVMKIFYFFFKWEHGHNILITKLVWTLTKCNFFRGLAKSHGVWIEIFLS